MPRIPVNFAPDTTDNGAVYSQLVRHQLSPSCLLSIAEQTVDGCKWGDLLAYTMSAN